MDNSQTEQYVVVASFDTCANNRVIVEMFRKPENAITFAKLQKQEFISCLSYDGALNEEESTESEEDGLYFFCGVAANNEERVTIRVSKKICLDESDPDNPNWIVSQDGRTCPICGGSKHVARDTEKREQHCISCDVRFRLTEEDALEMESGGDPVITHPIIDAFIQELRRAHERKEFELLPLQYTINGMIASLQEGQYLRDIDKDGLDLKATLLEQEMEEFSSCIETMERNDIYFDDKLHAVEKIMKHSTSKSLVQIVEAFLNDVSIVDTYGTYFENSDKQFVRCIAVPKEWLATFAFDRYHQTLEEFLSSYTWDQTDSIHELAHTEGVLLARWEPGLTEYQKESAAV